MLGNLILTVIFAVLFFITLILFIVYRYQVNQISKQLTFHLSEDSNQDIDLFLNYFEIRSLRRGINALKKKNQEYRIEYLKRENQIQKMITDVSHDIRTPLTSIKGYFQLLDTAGDEKEHYQEIINSRLETMTGMLDDFFVYSKLSQSPMERLKEQCDVKQILCETLFSYYDDLNYLHITPEVSLMENRFLVTGNIEDFQRIFMNLLKNAMVHGNEKLKITMEIIKNQVKIVFLNGTKETIPNNPNEVFERFYKGDSSRNNISSSGLGLCIVKELVTVFGGEVRAFSPKAGLFGIEMIFKGETRE